MTSSFTVNSALKSTAISRLFSWCQSTCPQCIHYYLSEGYPLGFPGQCRQGDFSGLIWWTYPNLLTSLYDWSFPWYYEKEVGITASLHVGFLYVKLSRGHLHSLLGLAPGILAQHWILSYMSNKFSLISLSLLTPIQIPSTLFPHVFPVFDSSDYPRLQFLGYVNFILKQRLSFPI